MRKVLFPRLQKQVEYVALCHPRRFCAMTNPQIRYEVFRLFHKYESCWSDYPLTLNSVSRAKWAIRNKLFKIDINEKIVKNNLNDSAYNNRFYNEQKAKLYDEIPNYLKPLLRKL